MTEVFFQVVTVLTVLSSLKIPFVRSKDDLKVGYTPPEARAFNELEVFREFNDGKDPVVAVIFVLAKDGGSMARITHLNETVDIVDYVGSHFPVKNYTYYRMCKNFCDANEPVRQFRVRYNLFTNVFLFMWSFKRMSKEAEKLMTSKTTIVRSHSQKQREIT